MRSHGPRKGFLDILLFSWANNVWFGISTLAVIFIYSSLGSAIPMLRQHPWLEMTEMEWFHWWPFKLMIAMLCCNVTIVTLRQIPLRWVNAGVWTIHVGILVLSTGSVYYFSTKVEGDAPVFRRRAVIRVPGQAEPTSLLIRPNSHVTVGTGADAYHFTVAQLFPEWQIASGQDKGKTAYMAWVEVVTPTQRFTRQLLAGYPQYTEDILPDRTRAKKTLGKALVDDTLDMTLAYEPQTEFFVMDTAALYLRKVGSDRWIERPIEKLPHYNDRIGSSDVVFSTPGEPPLPIRPIDIAVPAVDPNDPLPGYDFRVDAYLRYAFTTSMWRDGGDRLNPVAGLTLSSESAGRFDYELAAFEPNRNTAEQGQMVFRWVASGAELERLASSTSGHLTIRITEFGIEKTVPLGDDVVEQENTGEFSPIEGTPYAFRIKNVVRNLATQSGEFAGQTMSVAVVEIKSPEKTITRFVADKPGASRDLAEDGRMVQPDSSIDITLSPGVDAMLTLVAGPGDVGITVLMQGSEGTIERMPIAVGGTINLADSLMMRLNYLYENGVEDVRPRVVPRAERNRDAGKAFSMIRVTLNHGDQTQFQWLHFNRYALPNEQYAIPRRMFYRPTTLQLSDGTQVELLYSRRRHALPYPIALESFGLSTHTGGYSGATNTIRDFISVLRFKTDQGWSEPVQMSSNKPATMGGFWYFQSTWDPPAAGYGGMNYTGIGVGNRNGVYIQLAGTCIAVTGMIFAFYIKPIIRRRKQAASDAQGAGETAAQDSEYAAEELVTQSAGTTA